MRDLNLMKMAPNQTTMEREYNRDLIVCHFMKLSFTRTRQCQPLFYPKHRQIHMMPNSLLRGIVP